MRHSDSGRSATFIPVAVASAALLMVSFVLFSESPPPPTTGSVTKAVDASADKPVAGSQRRSAASLINDLRRSDEKTRERCLAEIAQCGDPAFIPELVRIHSESTALIARLTRTAEQLEALLPVDERPWDEWSKSEQDKYSETQIKLLEIDRQIDEHEANLELLTALRRLQNRPDPLGVFVTGFDPYSIVEWPDMPVLSISLRNIDTLQESVGFRFGGSARSGRAERFRCEVRNTSTGEVLPLLSPPSFIGGGQYHTGELKFSEGCHITLRLEDYVPQLDVGDYTVSVLYHNQEEIADRKFLDGLICNRSREYPFSVSKRTIYQTPEAAATMSALLKTVDRSQQVRIVEGEYGPWATEFIAADSPVGRLLAAGWEAVPALLNELDDESQTTMGRAHTLALLFSITHQVDPRGDREWFTYFPQEKSAIGPFEFIEPGRGVSWHSDGESVGSSSSFSFGRVERVGLPESAGFHLEAEAPDASDSVPLQLLQHLTTGSDSAPQMSLDRDMQSALVEKWKKLRDRIEVRDPHNDTAGSFESDAEGQTLPDTLRDKLARRTTSIE